MMGGGFWFSRTAGKISAPAREYWFVSMGEYADLGQASVFSARHAHFERRIQSRRFRKFFGFRAHRKRDREMRGVKSLMQEKTG